MEVRFSLFPSLLQDHITRDMSWDTFLRCSSLCAKSGHRCVIYLCPMPLVLVFFLHGLAALGGFYAVCCSISKQILGITQHTVSLVGTLLGEGRRDSPDAP